MEQIGRFIRELSKYRGTMVWIGVLTLVSSVLALQTPELIKQIFNFLDPRKSEPFHLPGPFSSLLGAFILLLLVSLAAGIMSYAMGVTTQAMGQRFLLDTRVKLYQHLQSLSQGFFEKSQTGKIVATVVNDVGQVNGLITGAFVTIIQDSVTLIGVLVLIFVQNPRLALLALSVYPIYIINYLVSRTGLSDNASKISELRGVILSDLQEKLAGISVVKSYAQERSEVRSYTHLNRDNLSLNIQQSKLGTWLWVRAELITAIGTAVVLCVGGQAVIHGELKQGDLGLEPT